MTINERLRLLREKLNLSTRAFGASINMSGSSITNMEKGIRNITDRTIRDICREYQVNRDWLITGKEPMFSDVIGDLNIDAEIKDIVHQYNLLNEDDKKLVKQMIDSLVSKLNQGS